MHSVTRRNLLAGLACSSLSLSSGAAIGESIVKQSLRYRDTAFLEIVREPDFITAFLGLNEPLPLTRTGARWETSGIRVRTEVGRHDLPIYIAAPGQRPTHIHLRWSIAVPANLLVLGDHWERSYGDLHWSCVVPERVMPWYFMASNGNRFTDMA